MSLKTLEPLKMWKKLSLRARLSLPMVAMIVVALVVGGIIALRIAPEQFGYMALIQLSGASTCPLSRSDNACAQLVVPVSGKIGNGTFSRRQDSKLG